MSQGRAATWLADNRLIAGGVALVVIIAVAAFALLRDGGSDQADTLRDGDGAAEASADPDLALTATATPGGSGEDGGRGRATVSAPDASDGGSVIPGVDETGKATACRAKDVDQVGVSKTEITIGQVVTEANQLPQQFGPTHEGLQAFVELYNKAGGLCGRKLKLEYRNDNLNPAIHSQDMRDLANRALAFVGNESLLDQLDYEQDPPFAPTVQGGGGFVPDVGGLAFSYPRSQSNWHAGVVGSVSPTLVGGAQYKYFTREAKSNGTPCQKGGVVYLNEPTGASRDQAELGAVSLEESWGGDLGKNQTKLYGANLLDSTPVYEALVTQMAGDGMNCVFAYTDLQSSINMARAMNNQGYWPPDKCTRGPKCFRVVYIPLSAYDPKFIADGGEGARHVSTFIPHTPLSEPSAPAMKTYLSALKAVPGAQPSTFSIFGYASGAMLIEALQACPTAPTRTCLMASLRKMKNFTAGGLLGGTTPFRRTQVTFDRYGSFNWKWVFNQTIGMRVLDRDGKRDFYRVNPNSGFFEDTLKVARGTPG